MLILIFKQLKLRIHNLFPLWNKNTNGDCSFAPETLVGKLGSKKVLYNHCMLTRKAYDKIIYLKLKCTCHHIIRHQCHLFANC